MLKIGQSVLVRRLKILKLTGGKTGEVYGHENGKNIVDFGNGFHGYYADDQLNTVCPFCGGSKIKPFLGSSSQKCVECDNQGFISRKKLEKYDLL